MSLLAGDGGEIRSAMLDRGFYISTTRQARAAFSELLSTVEVQGRARAVTSIGWTDGAFVLPDRTIGDTPENCIIYQGADTADDIYGSGGDLARWRKSVGSLAIGNSRLVFAIAAAFVGPLLNLLGEEGGGVNLRGPSSIGKSTALAAAASVWGSSSFVRQWRATSNGLEGICVQHNETLLALDELGQLDPNEAGSVAYMLANGMGKARASRSGAARASAKWKVLFLSSGEIGLAEIAGRDTRRGKRSAAGQEVRIIDIDADAGANLGLFETLHGSPSAEAFARKIKENAGRTYGVAGPKFVEQIIANRDGLPEELKRQIGAFVTDNVPLGADGQVARGARRFALIAAAGELAARLGVLPWQEGEATTACAKIFHQWLKGRGGTASAEDREAIARVRAFLEMHGNSRFESVDADDEGPRVINRAGFWRDTWEGREYLFLPEMWKSEVCSGMDARRVTKVLAERGFLQQDSGGKNSVSVNLPAGIGKARCYVIKSTIFDDDADA